MPRPDCLRDVDWLISAGGLGGGCETEWLSVGLVSLRRLGQGGSGGLRPAFLFSDARLKACPRLWEAVAWSESGGVMFVWEELLGVLQMNLEILKVCSVQSFNYSP